MLCRMNYLLLSFHANIDILPEKVKEVNEYFLLELLLFFYRPNLGTIPPMPIR